jgi:hypothetical protein
MNLPTARRRLLLGIGFGLLALAGGVHAKEEVYSEHHGVSLVRGSGKVVAESRTVTPFQGVLLKSGVHVVVRQAAKEAVEVRADDNLIGYIETTVVDRDGVPTLAIGAKKGASFTTRNRIVVTVDVASLKVLTLAGSGDVEADGLKTAELKLKVHGAGDVNLRQLSADALSIAVEGSGDVRASGRAAKLGVSIVGSGDVTCRDLQSDEVSVSIAGSGDARVHANRTLSVNIAGSGDVDYTGEATVRSAIAGSGSVTKR